MKTLFSMIRDMAERISGAEKEAIGPLYQHMVPDKIYHLLPKPEGDKFMEPTPIGSKEPPPKVGEKLHFLHNGKFVVVEVKSISQSIKDLAEEAAKLNPEK